MSFYNKFELFNQFVEEFNQNLKLFFISKDFWTDNSFGLFITIEDIAYGIGENCIGQLGQGHNRKSEQFVELVELRGQNIYEIIEGNCCLFAKNSNNEVFSWGGNNWSQLGRGFTSDLNEYFRPEKIKAFNSPIIQISCGDLHNMALSVDGCVYSWGDNSHGQICSEISECIIKTPLLIYFQEFLQKSIKFIYCFSNTSFVITDKFSVYFWGENTWSKNLKNQIIQPQKLENIKANKVVCNAEYIFFLYNGKISQYKEIILREFDLTNITDICIDVNLNLLCETKGQLYILHNECELRKANFQNIFEYYLNEYNSTYKTIQIDFSIASNIEFTSNKMASKCTISKKKSSQKLSSSIILSSNNRYVDKSCKIFADCNTVYFQCLTCDESRNSYICIQCKRNGNHEGHFLNQIDNVTDIVFCDCGDSNGIYFCTKHIRCEYPDNDKPLYRNEEDLRKLIQKLDLNFEEAIKLCRINQIKAVNMNSVEGKLIHNYFYNTNAHKFKDLEIKVCLSVYRKDQETRFLEKKFDQTREMLLWHGTKKESFAGILKNGFRKPSLDGVKNGAMFGRGIYFADRSSKSIQYCDKEGYGILFLCEVAVGAIFRTGLSRDHREVPQNFNCIKGLGKRCPDKNGEQKLGNIVVPCGTTIESPTVKKSELKYNEYIVFDPDRVLIRYIIAFKVDTSGCSIM